MIRTIDQIRRHVSFRRYTEEDWLLVYNFVLEHHAVRLRRPRSPKEDEAAADFIRWASCLSGFGDGDLVRCGEVCGLYHERAGITPGCVELCTWSGDDGEVHIDMIEVSGPVCSLSWNEHKTYMSRLYSMGYRYVPSLGSIVKQVSPRPGMIFKYVSPLHGVTVAIVNDYTEHDANILVGVSKGVVIPGYTESKIDVDMIPLSKKDVDGFNNALYSSGYRFDTDSKTLERCAVRVSRGVKYWYVNDRLEVIADRDMRSVSDDKRHAKGNYFSSRSDALSFLEGVRSLLRRSEE